MRQVTQSPLLIGLALQREIKNKIKVYKFIRTVIHRNIITKIQAMAI